ncbi:MAG TPA: GGDEF domain-containing protein [Ideonella sp.]|uniref:GGDEF domain-containing protein n=1 Tax=Ideonella sp. TaxID=1929293 RepID=UPI002C210A12|nr:GGDEF domain-containing protein [Ideonella sp.]HSI50429.1 GGDEF domain-containing protein [Ideonella sp.]
MSATPYQVFCLSPKLPDLITSGFGPFVLRSCATLDALSEQLNTQVADGSEIGPALLIHLPTAGGLDKLLQWPGLARAVMAAAVLVVAPEPAPATCLKLLQAGVREILSEREVNDEMMGRSLRIALERKRQDDAARRAYSIDLTTGLPNHHQLLEHMTHLLALREREPASMALIVLHLDGFRAAEASLGTESANVLRRKAAVRLRASLRASDVVASLGGDMFAVLLAWIDADDDAERVARKLLSSVTQPFQVTGHNVPLGARVGVGQYPAHGKDAQALLTRAVSQASGEAISRLRSVGAAAANDDE